MIRFNVGQVMVRLEGLPKATRREEYGFDDYS